MFDDLFLKEVENKSEGDFVELRKGREDGLQVRGFVGHRLVVHKLMELCEGDGGDLQ